jgi:hydroxyethylthiazole kinase-like uncharacterized protein yjeF
MESGAPVERRGYSAAQVRAAEQPLLAAGVPLMRRAASALAAEVRRRLAEHARSDPGRVLLLVGSGDNGGDTLFAGAELATDGVRVTAIPVGSRMRQDAEAAARAAGVRFERPDGAAAIARSVDLVLDGILGIGATPPLRGTAREVVIAIRSAIAEVGRPFVVAVDLPSGVDPDDGSVPDEAVLHAGVTVTFGAAKAGLLLSPGRELAGELRLVDLGLEPGLEGVEPLVRAVRRRAIVHGVVQGVGFRWSTREVAEGVGLVGSVRNQPDGSVEAQLEGDPEAVERMIAWLGEGPPGARVPRDDGARADGRIGLRHPVVQRLSSSRRSDGLPDHIDPGERGESQHGGDPDQHDHCGDLDPDQEPEDRRKPSDPSAGSACRRHGLQPTPKRTRCRRPQGAAASSSRWIRRGSPVLCDARSTERS